MNLSPAEPWRLPDGVDELLPPVVRRVEALRQAFLELGSRWGFDPVSPPLIESLDGLLTGTGEVMQRETFQIVDQVDGRTLGIRADMTPQVARMDALALASEQPNRLLYTGTVLRARAEGIGASRNPQQFGAELFGHAGAESDIELLRLMLETTLLTGVNAEQLVLDLGHVGVYAGLVAKAQLGASEAATLFDAMVRGSVPDVHELLTSLSPLCELRGFRYHTGLLFAVHDSRGQPLARGGRYDAVGQAFGSARAATGFSGDLKRLSELVAEVDGEHATSIGIAAADLEKPGAWDAVARLRADGHSVVTLLPDVRWPATVSGLLVQDSGKWSVHSQPDVTPDR